MLRLISIYPLLLQLCLYFNYAATNGLVTFKRNIVYQYLRMQEIFFAFYILTIQYPYSKGISISFLDSHVNANITKSTMDLHIVYLYNQLQFEMVRWDTRCNKCIIFSVFIVKQRLCDQFVCWINDYVFNFHKHFSEI